MRNRTAEFRRACKMVLAEDFEGDWGDLEDYDLQGKSKVPMTLDRLATDTWSIPDRPQTDP